MFKQTTRKIRSRERIGIIAALVLGFTLGACQPETEDAEPSAEIDTAVQQLKCVDVPQGPCPYISDGRPCGPAGTGVKMCSAQGHPRCPSMRQCVCACGL